MKHFRFVGRTIMVLNNNAEGTASLLQKININEGIAARVRRGRFFEKPFEKRNRICYERCRALYNEDMKKKIQFVMRKNRKDPFPR